MVETEKDRDSLQRALDLLVKWANEWGMVFNMEKCKVMHVGRHNPQNDYFMKGLKLATT